MLVVEKIYKKILKLLSWKWKLKYKSVGKVEKQARDPEAGIQAAAVIWNLTYIWQNWCWEYVSELITRDQKYESKA